jgi:dienelactone hydrolase
MRPGLFLLIIAIAFPLYAETPQANYKLANKFSSKQLAPMIYSTSVQPKWIGKTDTFWYAYRTSAGTSYWLVDPEKKSKKPLFDRTKLASHLAEQSRRPVDADTLNLSRTEVLNDGKIFRFVFADTLFEYDLAANKLTSKGKAPPAPPPSTGFGKRRSAEAWDEIDADGEPEADEADDTLSPQTKGKSTRVSRYVSPDKKASIYVKDYNLYFGDPGKETTQLTKDGHEDYTYALTPSGLNQPGPWSRDSEHFFAYRRDLRGVKELFVINSLAKPRPTLEKYKYPMPGEEAVRKSEILIGSRGSKTLIPIKPKWRDETYQHVRWERKESELRFVRVDRFHRNLELCAVDATKHAERVLIAEGFENAPIEYQAPYYLNDSDEMIWWSERTGWGHFYLYERNGKLKNAITSGAFRASRIVAVDEKQRILYFQANGREPGENVYYQHLYSIKLDGTDLKLLDPGNANHFSTLSPSRKFLVDNQTGVDVLPRSVLRDAVSGQEIMSLEKTDLSRLTTYGWKPAETFVVKAADGVTNLYGNMWKPFDFDPKKKYPILAHVYPGPQQEGVTHTFAAWSSNMQLAQLGFVVIQVGHRGGSPFRSKAYHSFGYYNLRDYGLADKKAAIEQLAARHDWIDLAKVGIFGHSGGGFMSAAAVLQKPYNEFFKAAVANAGNHDNNIYGYYWAERYHGMKEVPLQEEAKDKTKGPGDTASPAAPPVVAPPIKTKLEIQVPTNAELAANLKGRLMLVHGELDNNVHPANTMRLVDALIQANKRFDLLMLPGKRHGFGDYTPYVTRRTWEFFAEHLLGDRRHGADILENE